MPLMYAVLFDIDGTLVQTGGAGQLAFAETFAAEFGVREISGVVPFAGRSDRAIAADLMRMHGVEPSERNWLRFRAGYLDRLPAALRRRQGCVLPGVTELLDRLTEFAHPLLGLLTGNVRPGAEHKLRYYGLAERFSFGGFGDESLDRNDIAAAALTEARREALHRRSELNDAGQVDLAGVMVIGDTVHDVLCARSIEACAVAVSTGATTRDQLDAASPDLLLNDLSDPQPLLKIITTALNNGN